MWGGGGYVCVCVCIYIYICVCVCVCVHAHGCVYSDSKRILETSFEILADLIGDEIEAMKVMEVFGTNMVID